MAKFDGDRSSSLGWPLYSSWALMAEASSATCAGNVGLQSIEGWQVHRAGFTRLQGFFPDDITEHPRHRKQSLESRGGI